MQSILSKLIGRRTPSPNLASLPPVYWLGAPGPCGGAGTEMWDTMRIWRRFGLTLHVIPTWGCEWQLRNPLEEIGCHVHDLPGADCLLDVPGIRDGIVFGMCNDQFLAVAPAVRAAGCKTVWSPCMCWCFDAEREHYRSWGPFDGYHFQSEYQRQTISPALKRYGWRQRLGRVIHGAFCADSWTFAPRPHARGNEFFVGRLSRDDADKHSSREWELYGAILYPRRRARILGYGDNVRKKLGDPPAWAEVMPPCAEGSQAFLSSLHCLFSINGGARENWPRVGLEAMAAGVPVIAENQWGWREMIVSGWDGLLYDSPEEGAYHASRLAWDEGERMRLVKGARARAVELGDQAACAAAWRGLFEEAMRGD
jgi:hypothetical protein